MPTGKVKWFDVEKGFGFLSQDGGGADVYLPKGALPRDVESLKSGQRVEFGVAEGRRGPQALQVRVIDAPAAADTRRRSPDELHGLIEDMIQLLESRVQSELRRGRYPDRRSTKQLAEVVRVVARELEG